MLRSVPNIVTSGQKIMKDGTLGGNIFPSACSTIGTITSFTTRNVLHIIFYSVSEDA